jgi:RNA polymerase-associated protein CTR9
VIALAKGAYNSTSVQDIQAESLFFLARVYHVRDDLEHAHQFYDRACKLSPNLSPARFGLAQTLIAQEQYEEAAAHLLLVLGTSNTATDALATLGLLEVRSGKKMQEGLAHLRKAIDLDPLNPDLVLLEALALQQHETNFLRSLDRYKKAAQLMERQGKKIPFEIYTNIGVLCHETKNYDESLQMYRRALDAADDIQSRKLATLSNLGIAGGQIRHSDNSMFFDYVDTEFHVTYENTEAGTSSVMVTNSKGRDAAVLGLVVGDYVKIGDAFESQIVTIDIEGSFKMELKDKLTKITPVEVEGDTMDTDDEPTKTAALFVRRENSRLDHAPAISVAFNLARLHEVVGRTLAAVELHKAILKRNPAYVNSYLRLACIAIDCGALKECAGWLKIAAETAPGNPEVLTLIGNLHLSLCDWTPAQQVFDGLLTKKVQKVEAYAMLSLGNIYFANLSLPGRYAKHMGYAADFYKRILQKDTANAYAANGLGTVLAEKGELFKAKEIFNRVREVSGDAIADAHLNLGHVYLAQKRHPEALQMYQSYLKRTEDGSAPITSKSRTDDKVEVLMYISFAYFDWARQTELFNNAKAAPADERYKKAMEHLELALEENTNESKGILLTYNLCMTKLQAANCVLQKLTRNIRRTAAEVEEALIGLHKSHDTVEEILKKKNDGLKVTIATSMLNDFLTHCKSNIESARSHLEDERKREEDANELRELQRLTAESHRKKQEMEEQLKKEQDTRMDEERDRKVGIRGLASGILILKLNN